MPRRSEISPILTIGLALTLAACATRFTPEEGSPLRLTEACEGRIAPRVEQFGETGLRATYHFVTQDASDEDIRQLFARVHEEGFAYMPMTFNINGLDTLFVRGPQDLRTQEEADVEFEIACGLGIDPIYMTHVRYNPADQTDGPVRVR